MSALRVVLEKFLRYIAITRLLSLRLKRIILFMLRNFGLKNYSNR